MAHVFAEEFDKYKDLDYVAAFMFKAAKFNKIAQSSSAFVTTNSVSQGEQVAMLWPLIYAYDGFARGVAHKAIRSRRKSLPRAKSYSSAFEKSA